MNVHELSDMQLLVNIAIVEDEIFASINRKKDLLTEARSRKDLLKEKLKRLDKTIETVEYNGNINEI